MLSYVFYADNRVERQARASSERQVYGNNGGVPNYKEKLDEEGKQYWIRRVQEPDIQSLNRRGLGELRNRILDGGSSRYNRDSVDKWLSSIIGSNNSDLQRYGTNIEYSIPDDKQKELNKLRNKYGTIDDIKEPLLNK